MPAAPALNEQELARTGTTATRPKAVDNAFMLWMVGAALSLISLIVAFTVGADEIDAAARESLEAQGGSFTEQDVENIANASKIIGVVIGLAFIGLFVLFAYKMRAGRNWARITLSVLGGLSIVLTLIGVGSAGPVDLVVRLVQALLIVGAVYFMYRPESNNYFNAGAVRR